MYLPGHCYPAACSTSVLFSRVSESSADPLFLDLLVRGVDKNYFQRLVEVHKDKFNLFLFFTKLKELTIDKKFVKMQYSEFHV